MSGNPTLRAGISQDAAGDGLPAPRRTWAVIAIWLAVALAVIDASIANVALPTIAHDLGATPAASISVVNAYQVAIAVLLLPVASLGDLLGYRRIYAVGLALFVLASVGCAVAGDLAALTAARFAQGFGAAGLMAMNGALLRFTYPRAMLGRGLGYNTLVVAISAAAGPSIAAAILAVATWRWLFMVNVPIGLASLAIGLRSLPVTALSGGRFDWRSGLLSVLGFGSLFLVVSDVAQGAAAARTAVAAAIGVAAGAVAVRIARGQDAPLLPVDLLRIPILRLSYMTSACSFAAQMIGLVALPFYLQARLGYDHVQTGLLITAIPLGVGVSAPIAGRLAERHSAGLLGGVGLAVLTLGYLLIAALGGRAPTAALVAGMAACGLGFGLFQAPNNRTMLSVAPQNRSGAAAGMLAIARLVGQTLAAVAVALLFRLAGTTSVAPFLAAAALGVVAAALSLGRTRVA